MLSALLVFSVCLCPTAGGGVQQPAELLVQMGGSARMTCSHDLGGKYLEMFWHRQRPGESPTQVAYTVPYNDRPDFGEFGQQKFSATKTEAESGSLTVKDAQPADSGVYLCSVSVHTP